MTSGLVVLVGTDFALAAVGLFVLLTGRHQSVRGIRLSTAILMCFGALAVHFIGYTVFAGLLVAESGPPSPSDRLFSLLLSLATGAPAAVIFAMILLHSVSSSATSALFETTTRRAPDSRMARAREMVRQGDTAGAVEEYQAIEQEYPDDPEPILAAAGVLETVQRFDEAADLYRLFMRKFAKDDAMWVRGAKRLEALFREEFGDIGAAGHLAREIARREARRRGGGAPATAASMDVARRMLARGDLDAAVETFLAVFRAQPKAPRPLFEAEGALEQAGRKQEAAEMLRQVLRRFRHDDTVWCEAAYRLAGILEHDAGEEAAAEHLLREIAKRRPDSGVLRLAHNRLTQLRQQGWDSGNGRTHERDDVTPK